MTRKLNFPHLSVKVLSALFTLVAVVLFTAPAFAAGSTTLVISQVYGGGGNSGAPVTNDYIEILNISTTAIDMSQYSVQYSSSAGTSVGNSATGFTVLSGTLQPNHYYLVQESAGAASPHALPTPDASGSITVAGTAGKVFLVHSTAALTETSAATLCADSNIVDYVGFGGASAPNCAEGSTPGGTITTGAPLLANTTFAQRTSGGCIDTNNNATDFTAVTLTTTSMHNSSQTGSCSTSATAVGNAPVPSTVKIGNNTLLTVTVTPGTNPTSTGVSVKANLSAFGLGTAVAFNDAGTGGDATAGDNIFSYTLAVPGSQAINSYSIPVTVTDTQSDTIAPFNLSLSVATLTSTSTVLTTNPTAPVPNTSTQLIATITPNTATGTVIFKDAGTTIGTTGNVSGGVATTTISGGFSAGIHSLTAVYSGDVNDSTSTGTLLASVVAPVVPDFTLGVSNAQIITAGTVPSATATVYVTSVGGFSSAISLKCSGLPSNANCSFAPGTVTPSSSTPLVSSVVTFTIDTASNVKPGFGHKSGMVLAFTLLAVPFALRKRKSALRLMALFVVLLGSMQMLTGCATNGTPAGTSTVTITATAASGQVHTQTVTLVAQ